MHLVDDTLCFKENLNLKTFVYCYCMNPINIQYALKPSSSIQKYFQDLLIMFHVELFIIYLDLTKENNAF